MLLKEEREQVAAYCRRLVSEGLVKGTSGNISIRNEDHVAISPGSTDYEDMTAADVVVVDMAGNQVDGARQPSSELHMHLDAYAEPGVGAVVHSHAHFAATLSTVAPELPAIHYMIATLGGPVPVVNYHTFGSEELAIEVGQKLSGRKALILGNHGALTVGASVKEALKHSITLEWLCSVYWHAKLVGEPRILSDEELDAARAQMKHFAYSRTETGRAS